MFKTRILSIAPYDEFQTLIQQIASEYPEITLDTFTGNMDHAIEYIHSISIDEYDVIISRGGTAQKLRESSGIMVVEVEVSVYDMLRTLKIAEASKKPFAVVGYDNIIETASTLCQILNLPQIEIREVTQQTVIPCIRALAAKNIQLIIGDVITTEAASMLNLQGILVTSSPDSIRKALRTALSLSQSAQRLKDKQSLFLSAIDLCPSAVLVLDTQYRLIRSNIAAAKLDFSSIKARLQSAVAAAKSDTSFQCLHKTNDCIYDITAKKVQQDACEYYLCHISKLPVTVKNTGAIRIENADTPLEQSYFLFSDSTYIKPVLEQVQYARRTGDPVMIWGAIGTEKASVARYIHRNGLHANHPMICFDCQTLTEKQWQGFTQSPGSLLNGSGFTLFFENIQCLSAALQKSICNYLEDTQLQKRHQLISTCTADPNSLVLDGQLLPLLLRKLSQIIIHMPSLDSRKDDLEALASVCIAQLNRTLGLQIVGLMPEALSLLQQFHWYLNLDLFHKVIYQLAINTKGYYITKELTERVLEEFRQGKQPVQSNTWLDLSKTLEDIEADIIRYVLEEENMNQSRAAKRLNISRSTIWRKIN